MDWDCEFNSPDYWHFPQEVSIFFGANKKNQGIFSQYTDGVFFKEVDYCGITTGRKRDKFDDTGFTPMESSKISPPIIKECPYNIECKVTHDIMIGDWALILGEIVETHIDIDKTDESKRAGIDISKINPLVYCAEVREYWTIGNMLGYGFNAGKEIRTKLKDA